MTEKKVEKKVKKTQTILQKLIEVQASLKAPKSQFNSFGNYNYRSCEDILEAVKPLLHARRLTLIIQDEIVMIGDRYYVKANTVLRDQVTNDFIDNVAYAREEETKKGMDGSQITGASSSYARKYALNGLFLIDDTKDSDTTNQGEDKKESKSDKKTNILTKNCNKCDGVMFYSEGKGKKTGKDFKMWKCDKCEDIEWVTFPKKNREEQKYELKSENEKKFIEDLKDDEKPIEKFVEEMEQMTTKKFMEQNQDEEDNKKEGDDTNPEDWKRQK